MRQSLPMLSSLCETELVVGSVVSVFFFFFPFFFLLSFFNIIILLLGYKPMKLASWYPEGWIRGAGEKRGN